MDSPQEPVSSEQDDAAPQPSVRMTRRNTITSPITTPNRATRSAKLRAPTPVLGSPLRRSMRRRSVSITEDEHSNAAVGVKPQQLQSLLEEESSASSTLSVNRVTRSQSRSPLQPSPSSSLKTRNTRKPARKAETQFHDANLDSADEVEVTNLEAQDDEASSSKQLIIVLIDDGNNVEPKVIEDIQKDKNEATNKETAVVSQPTTEKSGDAQNINISDEVINIDDSLLDATNKTVDLFSEGSESTIAASETQTKIVHKCREPVVITSIQKLDNLTSQTIFKIQTTPKNSPLKNNYESPKTKSVTFSSSDSENVGKSSYPKTPVSTNSKSYINLDSSKETAPEEEFITETQDKEHEEEDKSSKSSGANMSKVVLDRLRRRALYSDDVCESNPPSDEEFLSETEEEEQDKSPKDLGHDILVATKTEEFIAIPSQSVQCSDDIDSQSENTPHKASPKLLKNVQSSTPLPDAVTKQIKKLTEEPTTTVEMQEKLDDSLDSSLKSLRSGKRYGETPSPKVSNKSGTKVEEKSPEISTKNPKAVEEFIQKAAAADSNEAAEIKTTPANDVSSTVPDNLLVAEYAQQTKESSAALPFAKHWTQSVSGKADKNASQKIDAIVDDVSLTNKTTENDITEKPTNEPDQSVKLVSKLNSRYASEGEDEEDEEEKVPTDDDEYEYSEVDDRDEEMQSFIAEEREYQRKEKPYRKRPFFEVEAVEVVDNYESGDSMDEEERREMEDNKIAEDGISIGSQDTEEEDDEEDDDNGDEEDNVDGFIVSDTEENLLLEYSDDDEHLESVEGKLKKKKFFKRIQTISSDSDSEVEEVQINKSDVNGLNEEEEEEKDQHKKDDASQPLVLEVTRMIDETLLSDGDGDDKSNDINASVIRIDDNSKELDSAKSEKKQKKRKSSLQCVETNESNSKSSEKDTDTEVQLMEGHKVEEEKASKSDESKRDSLSQSPRKGRRKSMPNDSQLNSKDKHECSVEKDDEVMQEKNDTKTKKPKRGSLNQSPLNEPRKFMLRESKLDISNASKEKKDDDKYENSGHSTTTAECKVKDKKEKECSLSASASEDENFNGPKSASPKLVDSAASATAELGVHFGQTKATNKDNVSVSKPSTQTNSTDSDGTQSSSESEPEIEQEESEDDNKQQPKFSSDDEQSEKLTKIEAHFSSKKTRRQSLSIPAGIPDSTTANVASNTLTTKASKRHSISAPSATIEERKSEIQAKALKRKRLSKSFCDDSMTTLDTTLGDDVRHLPKKSKIANDTTDEVDLVMGNKKTKQSASAPVEPPQSSAEGNDISRILGRCAEILKAADRAKFAAKVSYNKSLIRMPKKSRKRPKSSTSNKVHEEQEENNEADIFVPLASQKHSEQRKENTKLAATKTILPAPLGKKKNKAVKINEVNHAENYLPTKKFEANSNAEEEVQHPPPVPKKKRKLEYQTQDKQENPAHENSRKHQKQQQQQRTKPNLAADKKKTKKIAHTTKFELATGTVSVEPATPTTSSGFRESPLSPRIVKGLKVRQQLAAPNQAGPSSSAMPRKRKRPHEKAQLSPLPRPQWTKSGLFIEERLDGVATHKGKPKKRESGAVEATINASALNFKQKQMFRGDIPRESARALLQRKQRANWHN